MIRTVLPFAMVITLAGCAAFAPKPLTLAQMQEICNKERAEADGISGTATIGVNSRTGVRAQAGVNVNVNRLANPLNPQLVFDQCMARLMAQNAVIEAQ